MTIIQNKLDYYTYVLVDAVYAMAHSLHNLVVDECCNNTNLHSTAQEALQVYRCCCLDLCPFFCCRCCCVSAVVAVFIVGVVEIIALVDISIEVFFIFVVADVVVVIVFNKTRQLKELFRCLLLLRLQFLA